VPVNPARGKAQGRIDAAAKSEPWHRTADGSEAQKSTPTRPRSTAFSFTCPQPAAGHPDENQSGRTSGHERHVGPVGQKCRYRLAAALVRLDHPNTGANLRRAEPQERRRARTRAGRSVFPLEGRHFSSGQAAFARAAGSGTPRQRTRRCMTPPGQRDPSGSAREAGSVVSVRTGFADRTRPTDRRRRESRLLDRRMRGRRESVGTLATIERLTPNRPPARATPIRSRQERKTARANAAYTAARASERGRAAKRRSGIVRRPAAPDSATRLTCAVGDQTSGEVSDRAQGSDRTGRDGFVRSA